MSATDNNARPFSQFDWYGFAGAESWPNGDQPVLREVGNYLLVADSGGVEAHLEDDSWGMRVAFPAAKAACAFLNGLPDDFNPEAFGFEKY